MNAISKVCSWHWDTVFMVCKLRVGKSWKVASLSPQLQNPVKKKLQTDEEGVPEDWGSGQASQLSETHCNLMEVWSNVILDVCPKYQRLFVTFSKNRSCYFIFIAVFGLTSFILLIEYFNENSGQRGDLAPKNDCNF